MVTEQEVVEEAFYGYKEWIAEGSPKDRVRDIMPLKGVRFIGPFHFPEPEYLPEDMSQQYYKSYK